MVLPLHWLRARRALSKSERLPRELQNALKKPVDSFRHVWGAWSQVARLLNTKGDRNRHLFYSHTGEAHSLLEVNLAILWGSGKAMIHFQIRVRLPASRIIGALGDSAYCLSLPKFLIAQITVLATVESERYSFFPCSLLPIVKLDTISRCSQRRHENFPPQPPLLPLLPLLFSD